MKVSVGSQRMYFMGKELENDFNLHDYSVKVQKQKLTNMTNYDFKIKII